MGIIYIVIIAVLVVACAVLLALFVGERRRVQALDSQVAASDDALRQAQQALASEQTAHEAERMQRETAQMARVKAETELEAERRSRAEREEQQQEVERMMREQFRALAGDIMGEQSRRFKEENRESMDLILKPFRDNVVEFRALKRYLEGAEKSHKAFL